MSSEIAMHQLTIATPREGAATSDHADAHEALIALGRFVDQSDCMLQTIQSHPDFSSWDVLALHDDRRHAVATIELIRRAEPLANAYPAEAERDA
ncbi:hypothetical protein PP475_02720 [Mycobacteroides abscessus]|uniref:hypothetical protein n=1 Tax=Mycobacteroides abscessus TaxID=36809 RepID=UPI00069828FD|nr:hypothetical protein [Mycobacteroides abscessus]MDM2278392.1 hypothetical protein [Mycobacteroides abscessus]MDM2283551.1 hypothetical protein [Mycobacteroides abscessus]MDM2287818.1 hypothetical protein [Mycobacteroides abscessus]MDM2292133.1 hypothetical protein [Mycobacteroides abscessus]MDM2297286.1 hypothetical protein [Mycobacteroides abscessus]